MVINNDNFQNQTNHWKKCFIIISLSTISTWIPLVKKLLCCQKLFFFKLCVLETTALRAMQTNWREIMEWHHLAFSPSLLCFCLKKSNTWNMLKYMIHQISVIIPPFHMNHSRGKWKASNLRKIRQSRILYKPIEKIFRANDKSVIEFVLVQYGKYFPRFLNFTVISLA